MTTSAGPYCINVFTIKTASTIQTSPRDRVICFAQTCLGDRAVWSVHQWESFSAVKPTAEVNQDIGHPCLCYSFPLKHTPILPLTTSKRHPHLACFILTSQIPTVNCHVSEHLNVSLQDSSNSSTHVNFYERFQQLTFTVQRNHIVKAHGSNDKACGSHICFSSSANNILLCLTL